MQGIKKITYTNSMETIAGITSFINTVNMKNKHGKYFTSFSVKYKILK